MKVGDLVKYRDHHEGDPPINSIATSLRSWNEHGLVLEVCEDSFGWDYDEPAVDYINASGDIVRARQSDLRVINKI